MKIAILGPYTFSCNYSIKDFLSPDEKFYHNNEHTHPWISNLALGLSKIKGNDVHIIMLIPGISKDRVLQLDNVNYHLLKTTPKKNQIISFFNSNKKKVHKYIKKINPDIVHGQSRGRDSYFAVTSGYPCVITNHGQVEEHFVALNTKNMQYRVAKRFENKVSRKMNWCISVSPNCTDNCKKYIPESNIFQIDNAINYLFFKEYNLKYKKKIIYIGNITKLKRVFDLVKAIELVKGAELCIISNVVDKDYFYEIKSYIENNNLLKRVTFIKKLSQDELALKIAECTALCLPSGYESFGMVLA
ncbi:MAG: glycosyltransferase, partial [Ignavibacteriae bacterium]|nr:glycosyltransferase [Ignavibacteriota bacterium]